MHLKLLFSLIVCSRISATDLELTKNYDHGHPMLG